MTKALSQLFSCISAIRNGCLNGERFMISPLFPLSRLASISEIDSTTEDDPCDEAFIPIRVLLPESLAPLSRSSSMRSSAVIFIGVLGTSFYHNKLQKTNARGVSTSATLYQTFNVLYQTQLMSCSTFCAIECTQSLRSHILAVETVHLVRAVLHVEWYTLCKLLVCKQYT